MNDAIFAVILFAISGYIGYLVGRETTLEWVNKRYREIEKRHEN